MSMRIAVDIGFGFVKAMNDMGKEVVFPSVMTKRPETSLRGIVGGSGDDYSIIYWEETEEGQKNERKLFVGYAGMENGGTRKWEDKSEFNIEELKVLISTAVGVLNPDNKQVDVCVGLPMSYYIQKKDELINILESLKAKVHYDTINGIRVINFGSVFCFPQGAGAYYSAILDENGNVKDVGLATTSVGVIDVGYRTTDYLIMGKGRNGVVIKDFLSGSLEEEGMNKAFQEIERKISEEIGKNVGLMEVEKSILWFGSKLDHRSGQFHLLEYEDQAYKELAERIISQLKIKWGDEADRLSVILVTGGGGETLYPVLKEKFEHAELQTNPSFANCKGYLGAQALKMKSENKRERA